MRISDGSVHLLPRAGGTNVATPDALCGSCVIIAARWLDRAERFAASLVATQTPTVTIIAAIAGLEN
jgi:hypothetical protein